MSVSLSSGQHSGSPLHFRSLLHLGSVQGARSCLYTAVLAKTQAARSPQPPRLLLRGPPTSDPPTTPPFAVPPPSRRLHARTHRYTCAIERSEPIFSRTHAVESRRPRAGVRTRSRGYTVHGGASTLLPSFSSSAARSKPNQTRQWMLCVGRAAFASKKICVHARTRARVSTGWASRPLACTLHYYRPPVRVQAVHDWTTTA